jgi:flagellar motor switch protein FliN/FliY
MSDEPENVVEEAEAPGADSAAIDERISMENMRVLENIDVSLTVEVGSAEIKIRDLLRLNEGSVIELDRLAGDPLDILANGTMIAKGEVVMVGERFGIRFSEIVAPEKRMETL